MTYLQRTVRAKYGNKSQHYNGRTYHSKFEAQHAEALDLQRKADNPRERVVEVEPQFKVSIDIEGADGKTRHITNYYVDFRVTFADGHVELHEVKGYETEVWRLKALLLEAVYLPQNPDTEYVVVKQKYDSGWAKRRSTKR